MEPALRNCVRQGERILQNSRATASTLIYFPRCLVPMRTIFERGGNSSHVEGTHFSSYETNAVEQCRSIARGQALVYSVLSLPCNQIVARRVYNGLRPSTHRNIGRNENVEEEEEKDNQVRYT